MPGAAPLGRLYSMPVSMLRFLCQTKRNHAPCIFNLKPFLAVIPVLKHIFITSVNKSKHNLTIPKSIIPHQIFSPCSYVLVTVLATVCNSYVLGLRFAPYLIIFEPLYLYLIMNTWTISQICTYYWNHRLNAWHQVTTCLIATMWLEKHLSLKRLSSAFRARSKVSKT